MLLGTLTRCFKNEITSPILARLFLITFRYSQTILMSSVIEYTQGKVSSSGRVDTGYWLVVLTFIIYGGLAVSSKLACGVLHYLTWLWIDLDICISTSAQPPASKATWCSDWSCACSIFASASP